MNYIVTVLLIFLINGCGTTSESETTPMNRNNNNFDPESKKPEQPPKRPEQPPKKPEQPPKRSDQSSPNPLDSAAKNLLHHQQKNFDKILKELQDNGKKISHWIWWVFPTEMPGQSEPQPKSSVSVSQADGVLAKADIDKWTKILELMASLLENNPPAGNSAIPNSSIIPSIDHGRISFALDFWLKKVEKQTKKYDGFYRALQRLNNFKWR